MRRKLFTKVYTQKIYVQIIHQIEDLIERGVLKQGDKLPSEPEFAKQLGTSRPPLREALSALEMLGIIERRGRKGNFIRASTDSISYKRQLRELSKDVSPYEALEARKIVETEIARIAAKVATKKDIEIIRKVFQKMKEKVEKFDSSLTFQEVVEHDIQFHLSIAEATHNGVLVETVRYMVAGLKGKLWIKMKMQASNFRRRVQEIMLEHEKILNALIEKDGEMARRKMYEHLEAAEKEMFDR